MNGMWTMKLEENRINQDGPILNRNTESKSQSRGEI